MTPEQDEAENKRDRMVNLHINSLTWKLVELIELSVAKNEIKVLASQLHEAMKRNVAANFLSKEMGIPSVPDFDAAMEKAWLGNYTDRIQKVFGNNAVIEHVPETPLEFKNGFRAGFDAATKGGG